MGGDLRVVGLAELDPVAVLDVRDDTPRRLAQRVALSGGSGDLGIPLLELDGVAPRGLGRRNERTRHVEAPVVVDPDLGHHVAGPAGADLPVEDFHDGCHPWIFHGP